MIEQVGAQNYSRLNTVVYRTCSVIGWSRTVVCSLFRENINWYSEVVSRSNGAHTAR